MARLRRCYMSQPLLLSELTFWRRTILAVAMLILWLWRSLFFCL